MILELSKEEIATIKRTYLLLYLSVVFLISLAVNMGLMFVDIVYDFLLYMNENGGAFLRMYIIYVNMAFVFGSMILALVFTVLSGRALGAEAKWMQIVKKYADAKKTDTIIECESSEEIVTVAKELAELYGEKNKNDGYEDSIAKTKYFYRIRLIKKFTNLVCQDQNIASYKCLWVSFVVFGFIALKELSFIILLIVAG